MKGHAMKAKKVGTFAKVAKKSFKGGVPKDRRQAKGLPGGKVLPDRKARGEGIKYKLETYQTVTSFKPGTRIQYIPNPKTPGSKSYTRYARYEKAKTVGESLKCGTYLGDLCYELERGMYKVLGGERSEKAEKAAIGEMWFNKAQKMLRRFHGPHGLNVNLHDPKAAENLKKEDEWREGKLELVAKLAKTHKIKIENEDELKKQGVNEAYEVHAERKVCDFICAKKLQEAKKTGKKITYADLTEAMSLWGYKQNIGRLNVMPPGVKYVYSDTIGAIRRRSFGYGLTGATRNYPNFVKLLCQWLKDNRLEEKLGCDFKFTAINLNANYAGSRHRDAGNEGPSAIRAVGNFKGGKLVYWPKDPRKKSDLKKLSPKDSKVFDLAKETVLFDGNCAHEVQPFDGHRYSIVYFTTTGFQKVPPADVKYLESLGMPYPTVKAMADLKSATKKLGAGTGKVSSLKKAKKFLLKT